MEAGVRILLVANDTELIADVEAAFDVEGFVFEPSGFDDALQLTKDYEYDAVVVDFGAESGSNFLARMRATRVVAPILAISRAARAALIAKALDLGADDCLGWPFDHGEFVARVRAIVRRSNGHASPTIRIGKLAVDLGNRVAKVNNKELRLTIKEYGVLELLSLRKGKILKKDVFLDHLYSGRDEPQLKIVDVFICKLRKKLAAASDGEDYIKTIWGLGYTILDADSNGGVMCRAGCSTYP
jgi:two-component system, cell cycle response regulator CtrA